MRLNATIFLTALLFTSPSFGEQDPQRQLKAGLNYTAFPKFEKIEPAAGEQKDLPTAPTPPQVTPVAKPKMPAAAPQEPVETTIWNKYKALAAGTAKDTGVETEEKEEIKTLDLEQPEDAAQMEEPQAEQKASGIQALLQDWQQNKNSQKDMRSKSFAVPEGLGTVKDKNANEKSK